MDTQESVQRFCNNKCIVSAIMQNVYELKNDKNSSEMCLKNSKREETIKFLIHFIQDFNQPLHLVGFYRGGNDFMVVRNKNNRNKTTNLHSIWDSEIPEYFHSHYGWNTQVVHQRSFSSTMDYYIFLLEILSKNKVVACDYIYGKFKDVRYLVFDEYFNESYQRMLFEHYLELAGEHFSVHIQVKLFK
jgi:heme-degrading monooxygenase HmoA